MNNKNEYIIEYYGSYLKVSCDLYSWDLVKNPHKATPFINKQGAKKWIKQNTAIEKSDYTLKHKKEICYIFDKWVEEGMIISSHPPLDRTIARKYNGETKKEVLDWHVRKTIAQNNDNFVIRHDDEETWPELSEIFECISCFESFLHDEDDENSDIKYSFYFCLEKDSKYSVFKKELDLVLPYVTFKTISPKNEKKKGLIVMIEQCHTRSQLKIYDNRYVVEDWYCGEKKTFKKLKDAFNWILDNQID